MLLATNHQGLPPLPVTNVQRASADAESPLSVIPPQGALGVSGQNTTGVSRVPSMVSLPSTVTSIFGASLMTHPCCMVRASSFGMVKLDVTWIRESFFQIVAFATVPWTACHWELSTVIVLSTDNSPALKIYFFD